MKPDFERMRYVYTYTYYVVRITSYKNFSLRSVRWTFREMGIERAGCKWVKISPIWVIFNYTLPCVCDHLLARLTCPGIKQVNRLFDPNGLFYGADAITLEGQDAVRAEQSKL